MFSRIFLSLLCLTFVACAGESRPSQPAIDVRLKNSGECLSQMGSSLKRYFAAQLSRAEVAEFWDCASSAVGEYQRLTAGDLGDNAYSPQAVRRFLYRYFFKTRPLSDPLLANFMEVKRVLLSGSVNEITREEIRKLQDFITELKAFSLALHPHVPVLFGDRLATDKEVEQAALTLTYGARRVGAWLHRGQQPYAFSQVGTLFHELKTWMVDGGADVGSLATLESVIQVLPVLKRVLIAGPPDRIAGDEWAPLFQMAGHGLHVFLNFKHAFKQDLNSSLVRDLLPGAIQQFGMMLEQALSRRADKVIPLAEWQSLFVALERSQWLPAEFSARAMDQGFKWFVVRALGNGQSSESLQVPHVRRLLEQQSIWRKLLASVDGENVTDLPVKAAFEEVLSRSVPMQWDSEGRLEHPGTGASAWAPSDLRRMVWPFVILNWLRESYVGAKPTLNEADMMTAVQEILPVLQGFGWMSTTQLSIGKRLLREADLFTLASNGDRQLDLSEATRYMAFVASSYRVVQIWLEEADQNCVNRNAECVRRLVTRPESRVLEPLPKLHTRVLAEDPAIFIKYMKQAEETVLGQVIVGPMSTTNLLQTWMLFQYVETFLRLYDVQSNEKIELSESLVAFQVYGPTLGKLLPVPDLPEDEVLAFFTFMMKYGDTPFSMLGGQVLFLHWKWHRNDWEFSADRSTLMSILNQLSKL